MKRLQEEEIKGPPELISSNPKSFNSSDDSDQVKFNYTRLTQYYFLLTSNFFVYLIGRRRG